jgi:BirA family biotin operon repressor/biotin-[acetyl-CoA-carboxylase] ligase
MGKRVVYMPSCHSTNDVASDLLKNGSIEEGTIVITDHQIHGRGQQGNQWEADQGKNITCSLILKPKPLLVKEQFVLNVMISLGVADLVEKVTSKDANVKWPNDIYCEGHKICGILISNIVRKNTIETTVAGIGLNVNQMQFMNGNATSLALLSGNVTYNLEQILESLIMAVEKRYFQWKNNCDDLWDDYLSKLYWLDEVRTFEANDEYFTGMIRGVSRTGQLLIEDEVGVKEFEFKTIRFAK